MGKKRKDPKAGALKDQMVNKQAARATPGRKPSSETVNPHTVSAAVDDILVEEIRKLRNIIEVTIVKGFAGIRPHEKVKEEMAAIMARELKWKVQPFEDDKVDRMLLHCPSEDLARKIENMKEIEFPGFIVQCTPCTAATNASRKADGELRWITVKGLPIFCQRRDTLARLLKPVGDLAYMAKGGAFYAGHCRAAVRILRGRTLPTTIYYNVLNEKFTIQIQLDRGESPLPWDPSPEKMAAPEMQGKKEGGTPTPVDARPFGPPEKILRSKKDATGDKTVLGGGKLEDLEADGDQSMEPQKENTKTPLEVGNHVPEEPTDPEDTIRGSNNPQPGDPNLVESSKSIIGPEDNRLIITSYQGENQYLIPPHTNGGIFMESGIILLIPHGKPLWGNSTKKKKGHHKIPIWRYNTPQHHGRMTHKRKLEQKLQKKPSGAV
ncbi:hypothetical protein J5N97_024369 [Dioscorea zingiberensis]|uniref:Uncharacterized protein n=1 Tax=Dioscorea zingiberensis TaxID=325984 RepID=A0A9D5C7N1_9LILI|nr:hypothetical protein J5N97_024369 [Dioscorea zingiberensis]